jgi:dihydroorotate dehydrogenase electron transfer subunit
VLFRIRGVGGRLLADKLPGDKLDILGPLGQDFRLADSLKTAVIVTGGIGIAPVPALVEALVTRGLRTLVLAGAKDDETIPYPIARPRAGRATIPALEELGAEVTFVSEAVEGVLITEVVALRLGEFGEGTGMFAVGPRAMLKQLVEVTGEHFSLQVSLEERMACGLGACRSCVVPVRSGSPTGYLTVCRDGPVFDANVIDWERLEP